jgi:hypothetical protein
VGSYASEAPQFTSEAEAAGTEYLVKNLHNDDTLYDNRLFYGEFYTLNFFNDPTRNFNMSYHIARANVVYFSQSLFNSEYFSTGNDQNAYKQQFIGTISDTGFNRVYSNPEFTMFKRP